MDAKQVKETLEQRAMGVLGRSLDRLEDTVMDKVEDQLYTVTLTGILNLLKRIQTELKQLKGGKFMLERRFIDFTNNVLAGAYFVLDANSTDNEVVDTIRVNVMNSIGRIVNEVNVVMKSLPQAGRKTRWFHKQPIMTDDEIKTHRAKVLLEKVPEWKAKLEGVVSDNITVVQIAMSMRETESKRPISGELNE